MAAFLNHAGYPVLLAALLVCCACIPPVWAADAYYEGNLGDVIELQGASYLGTQVYLFLTGPGLPENGVMLTDTNQRADEGHFTVIDLNSSQKWSMRWNTQRIKSQIDPGTYTVYAATDPVDLSNISSARSYQTLEVYLKDADSTTGGGAVYTMHPMSRDTPVPATTPLPTTPVTTTVTAMETTVPPAAPVASPPPATTKSPLPPALPLGALAVVLLLVRRT